MPADQRRIVVSLTDKSKKLVDEMAPLIVEQYELIEETLGKALLRDLYATLDRDAPGKYRYPPDGSSSW